MGKHAPLTRVNVRWHKDNLALEPVKTVLFLRFHHMTAWVVKNFRLYQKIMGSIMVTSKVEKGTEEVLWYTQKENSKDQNLKVNL